MRSKEYRAFLEIQSFISKHSCERNRDEMENLGKCLGVLDSAIRELDFIHKKMENDRITPLEALQNIKLKLMRSYDGKIGMNGIVMFEKEIPIIETALKENERLKTCYIENLLNEESKEYIYKKIKALNIIKDKAKFHLLQLNGYLFTKEEYDLLKEVLL